MRDRAKRRRLNSDDTSPPPETIIDKSSWNGFCEIESEPVCVSVRVYKQKADWLQASFNVMLREFGVEGVRVQELFSLDESTFNELPHVSSVLEL